MSARLRGLGYSVDTALLSPHNFGVPQSRERLFIVGSLDGLGHFSWPRRTQEKPSIASILESEPTGARPLSERHENALELWQEFLERIPAREGLPSFPIWTAEFGATYPFEEQTPTSIPVAALREFRGSHGHPIAGRTSREALEWVPPYARSREQRFPAWKQRFIRLNREFYWRNRPSLEKWVPRIAELSPSLQKLEWNCQGGERNIRNYLIQFRASGVRVRRPNLAPSLIAMNATQVPVVAWQSRHMTSRECARLQSMDELPSLPSSDERAFRALGNAVNVSIVQRIADALMQPEHSAKAKRAPAQRLQHFPKKTKGGMAKRDRVNIKPGVSVLSVLKHLNYKPWYALAEFVDNAIQSHIDNEKALTRAEGKRKRLRVSIEIDQDNRTLTVRDSAAGIDQESYTRAFRTAEVPPDRKGLSEFGMGMKAASCWFAPRWSVRTKALGETDEKTISFDISKIVKDSIEELEIHTKKSTSKSHFTEIVLSELHRPPQTKTLGKIKSHLASIYRDFIRRGKLELRINNEAPLEYAEPEILRASFFKTPKGPKRRWKKEINFKLGGGRRVHGFAALRAYGSTSEAGFALFRRGRLIEGSGDEGYRPEQIFGKSNSFVYQRLFGELTLEGFDVSHTKDGIRWDEAEDDFLALLKKQLDASPLPLLQQAKEHRSKPSKAELQKASESALAGAADELQEHGSDALEGAFDTGVEELPPKRFGKAAKLARRVIALERHGAKWEIILETTADASVGNWVDLFDQPPAKGRRRLGVRVSLAHPFMAQFAGSEEEILEPLVRIAAALGLAETTARDAGVKKAGTIRMHLNELLREAFSRLK